jgi:hypothetical protein
MPTKFNAYQFGQAMAVKLAWSPDRPGGTYGSTMALGLGGAGLGGLLGGVYGAAHPGEETDGKRKKPRSKLQGALRGLAAGGLIGGGVGAGAGLLHDANAEATPVELFPGVSVKPEAIDNAAKKIEDATNAAKQKWEETRKSWGF